MAFAGSTGALLAEPVADVAARITTPSSAEPAAPGAEPAAPGATMEAGGRYAEAAVAALNADPLAVHIEQVVTATSTRGGWTVETLATMSGNVSGKNLSVEVWAISAGQHVNAKVRVVGRAAYAMVKGAWVKRKRSQVKEQIEALHEAIRLVDDPLDLRYVGVERVGKRDLIHLTAATSIPYEPILHGPTGRFDAFDLWVTKDGTPVRFEGRFSAGGGADRYTGTTTIGFSKYGVKIKIKAPKIGR